MEPKKILTLIVACGLLAFISGCFGEDDIPTVPTIPTIDPAAEMVAGEGENVATDLIADLNSWAQGTLGKDLKTLPEWDPVCQCWRWVELEGDYYSNPSWSRTWTFAVGFFANDVAQMEFEGADRIHGDIEYSYAKNYYVDDSDYYNYNYFLELSLDATNLPAGPVNIAGEGSGHIYIEHVDGDFEIEKYEEIVVAIDFSIPLGGCPTGTMTFTVGTSVLTITFDGTATASWRYVPDGNEDAASSDTFTLVCGG